MVFPLLPIRFLGYDSAIYLVSAIIGFLIAYRAYKLYDMTNKKQHFYFYIAFMIFSVSLLTISLTSGYSYVKYLSEGVLNVFDPLFGIDDLGYWIYFGGSFTAYLFLVLTYAKERSGLWITLPIASQITFNYFTYFNVILFFLIVYVAFRSATNYFLRKSFNSFLVMSSFILIGIYHGLLMFTAFSKLIYVAAHFSLILGFLALLWMLIRVGRK